MKYACVLFVFTLLKVCTGRFNFLSFWTFTFRNGPKPWTVPAIVILGILSRCLLSCVNCAFSRRYSFYRGICSIVGFLKFSVFCIRISFSNFSSYIGELHFLKFTNLVEFMVYAYRSISLSFCTLWSFAPWSLLFFTTRSKAWGKIFSSLIFRMKSFSKGSSFESRLLNSSVSWRSDIEYRLLFSNGWFFTDLYFGLFFSSLWVKSFFSTGN